MSVIEKKIETIPVHVESYGSTSTGTVSIRHYSPSERIRRTFATFGIGFLITILSVLIPVAHFILVPLGFIATPVIAFLTYRRTENIVSGTAPCPKCQAQIQIQKRAVAWPVNETCQGCSRALSITRN